jgi:integrase
VSATAERPAVGRCCYKPPVATCSQCGKERPCQHADTEAPVCLGCANRSIGECGFCGRVRRIVRKASEGSPALGICCYELPRATCTDCGQQRPCYRARTNDPVCERCTRVRRAPVCVGCGQRRVTYRHTDGGILCQTCNVKQGNTTGACGGCGQVAPLIGGSCAACRLRVEVDQLAAGASVEVAATLAPFLRNLGRAENPSSTLRWFYTPGFDVTRRMLDGEIAISHHGLDQAAVEAAAAVAFVRAKLVDSGVLEPRDEASARFAEWHATAVLQIPAGTDRAHVRGYATWHVGHQLSRTVQRRGEAGRASIKYARSLVSEAIKLTVWLHGQRLELADLRQDLVDQWIVGGSMLRRRVRLFLAWLARASVTGVLDVAWDDRAATRHAIGDRERFAILRRLLHDDELDLRDRFAGSVLLLYGQPITRIAALTITDIDITRSGAITLRLGRGVVVLPDPLAQIALRLSDRQLCRAGTDRWLFPGRHAGHHITADTLRRRLKSYGIDRSREGRHAALLALAARLPAPVLAERIGIHQSRAAAWVRMAGDTYADYVALRLPD